VVIDVKWRAGLFEGRRCGDLYQSLLRDRCYAACDLGVGCRGNGRGAREKASRLMTRESVANDAFGMCSGPAHFPDEVRSSHFDVRLHVAIHGREWIEKEQRTNGQRTKALFGSKA